MPKQALTGSLEEQCAFLYEIATDKMAQGNFTGAYHALKEIVKHKPDFEDAQMLYEEAKRKKSEQRFLLSISFVGVFLAVGLGSFLQISNDFLYIGMAIVGAILGYVVATWLNGFRRVPT
ncbi:MAG: hypothetical protein AAF702_19775 [Chloroflexota bacterium]